MGKTVIFTDQKELTLRQIVETYDARNQIETDIAYLKEKLLIPLKPVYVRKDTQNPGACILVCNWFIVV